MATIDFDRVNKQILIGGTGDQSLTIQEIYDAIIDYQDEPGNMDLPDLVQAAGKQDLRPSVPGTKLVGVTMTLLDGWQLKAVDTDHTGPALDTVTIADGNLVALDSLGNGQSPLLPTAFVAYVVESDVSAGLLSANITAAEASIAVLEQHISNRKDIDFTGDDALGWQEVVYDDDGTTVLARFNLYDETGTRINTSVAAFVLANKMIASRRPA